MNTQISQFDTPSCNEDHISSTPIDDIPVPILQRNITQDTRIDALHSRFPWLSAPAHQWSALDFHNIPVNTYHLRRRPQIRCPACLVGELGQLAHMQGPHGCLYDSDADMLLQLSRGESTIDYHYNVDNV